MSCLVKVRKLLGNMKYLMSSVKRESEEVGIWSEDNWDVKRVNSLYTMVPGRLNFKINQRFDSLIWSLFVRYLYTSRGYIIGEHITDVKIGRASVICMVISLT